VLSRRFTQPRLLSHSRPFFPTALALALMAGDCYSQKAATSARRKKDCELQKGIACAILNKL
jgi:hypothetical protein